MKSGYNDLLYICEDVNRNTRMEKGIIKFLILSERKQIEGSDISEQKST